MRKKLYATFEYWNIRIKVMLLVGLLFSGTTSLRAQTLVWEENFNGTAIDPETWTFDFGDGCERGICGWGNNELEYYTSRPENARVENGSLVIEARRENFQSKPFTSARLKTLGRVQFKYGTLEARIKVPNMVDGLWPAFWMLGSTGTWPASGEIDIMEMGSAAARQANVTNKRVGGAVHWENNNAHAYYDRFLDSPTDLSGDYHVYKMSWDSNYIRMYMDGAEYFAIDISKADVADLEEFHKSQFILLNLAVGGQYTGINDPNNVTAPLPAQMLVDYIKLYQNPGDELFLGKNNAVAGDFGVYTEKATITNKLVYGQNAQLYYWNNLVNITSPTPVPFEGSEVLALRAAAGNWFGFGVETPPMNLLSFANGDLKFQFKTTYTGQFKVGLKSGHGETWINYPAGATQYGLIRDGQWHEVTIPLTAFQQPNAGMNLDLGSVTQAFMFAGDAGSSNADFYFDNIYFSGGVAANPAPTVTITSPVNEAVVTVPGNLTINATAADANGSVTKVEFFNGTTLLGTSTTAPYNFTWANVPAGVYTLTAKATDNEGVVTTSAPVMVFAATANNTAANVSITSPVASAKYTFPASITINANATDPDGSVYKVDFYNGNTLLGTDFTSPYSFTWANVAVGDYTLTAQVTDNGKLTAVSAPVTVSVSDNTVAGGDFGIFSEDAQITRKLVYEQDAKLFIWNNLAAITPTPVAFEGNEVLAFRAAPGNWFGFGIDNDIKNLTYFADGSLKFRVKTTYAGQFKVGIKSGAGKESWIEFPAGASPYGLVRDGAWHEVNIPFKAFSGLELATVDQVFMFAGDAPTASADFNFDHIYYSAQPVVTTPPTGTDGYCATTPDYSYKAVTTGGNVTFTFHPLGATAGGNLAIIYIREGGAGAYPGYGMVKNEAGDFTYTKPIAAGTVTSIYFTYQVGAGGPERNSAATPHSYTVGTTCSTAPTNVPPTVSISAPVNNATFTAPATMAITANAADTDGTVAKVEFFQGTTKLGEVTAAPFTFTWTNVAAGTYSLTAKATDNAGGTIVSDAITVSVNGGTTNPDGWNLVWADEFTNDISADWVFETGRGDNGWGNRELQYYRQENAKVQNGELVITAKKENFGGAEYTSARLKTQGKKAFKYGKIEAKIAMPSAKGLWPAFWMLGSNITTVGWPSSGEIDIMEHINADPEVHGTIHWSSADGTYANYGGKTPADVTVAHVYGIEWDASAIKWFIDGKKFHEVNIADGVNGTDEFHEEFFLLLNMAVGGNWPGFEVDNAAFPANMYVDYVRVYQKETPYTGPTVRITAPANNALVTPGSTIKIEVSASDAVNQVTKVEFFNGTTRLGEDTTAPYSFDLTNVVVGTYTLTAKVTNNLNMTATSTAKTVIVKDNVVPGDLYGIYTEQPTINNKVVYGQDANIYLWNNLVNITPAPAPFEGNEVLAFRASPGNWFGFGVDVDLKNLSAYADGALKFHFKTTYAGQIRIGLKSSTGDNWVDFNPAVEKYGLKRDGLWHEVSIPFKDFPNINLATLDQAFMLAGDAPTTVADFYIDNIYYSAQPPQANVAPQVSISAPTNNAILTAPASIAITALATDSDGTVAKVAFFNGTTKLGEVNAAPFTFNWEAIGVGTYTLTAQATDNSGATTSSEPIKITVTYPDKDNDGYTSNMDCNDQDATINPGATDLCDGIDRNCDGKVSTPLAAPVITVIPASSVYTGGNAQTIYLGYGAQSVTLSATTSSSADLNYTWSPATGLSNAAIAKPVFTPTKAGTYTFTLTVGYKSNPACQATASVTITVIDARGGKKLDKVLVCHLGQLLELNAKQVAQHLDHNDILGSCARGIVSVKIPGNQEQGQVALNLSAYPNPTRDKTTIEFALPEAGKYHLAIYDSKGVLVKKVASGNGAGNSLLSFTFDAKQHRAGIYVIKLITDTGVYTRRIVVE